MRQYRENSFPVTIVRPSLTYGPSQIPLAVGSWNHPYTVIDRMRKGKKIIVPGDGTSLWTCTYNTDFAKGLLGLLGMEKALGHAFHITSDEVLSWDQIYRETAHALGVEADIVHLPSELIAAYAPWELGSLLGDKAVSTVFDNSKIKRFVPDFKATVRWREGVRKAIAWHEENDARRSVDEGANALWDRMISDYNKILPKGK